MSVVLHTDHNVNYVPTEEEVLAYAEWLGMKLPEDNSLLWIAREGLMAPLPENWKACRSDKGDLYYFNYKTGQSIWDHPLDDEYKERFKTEKKKLNSVTIGTTANKTDDVLDPLKKAKGKSHVEVQEDSGPNIVLSPRPKVPKLNTLILTKVLPETPKASFEGTKVTGGNKVKLNPLENCSKSKDSHYTKSDSTGTSHGAPSQGVHEEVIAGGISGLKALSRLNSPPGEKKGSGHEGEKPSFGTSVGSPLSNKEESEREKELLLKQMKEELNQLKQEVINEQKETLEKYRRELDQQLVDEKQKITQDFSKSIEDLRHEYDEQKRVEANLLKEKLKCELEEEKKRIKESSEKELEEFRHKTLADSHKKKESQSAAVREVGNWLSDIKELGSSFTQTYEDTYSMLSEAISRSFADTTMKHALIEQKKKEFELELRNLQEDHRALILQEKERFMNEMEELKRSHLEQLAEKNRLHERRISTLMDDHQKRAIEVSDELKKFQELKDMQKTKEDQISESARERTKEHEGRLPNVISSSQEELEKMKRELLENARAEIRSAFEEMNSEIRTISQRGKSNSLGYSSSSPSCSNKNKLSPKLYVSDPMSWEKNSDISKSGGESEDLSKQQNRNSSTPVVSESPVQSTSEGNDHCLPSSRELGNLKTVLTEVLKDVFEKSPFIISSPSKKEHKNNLFSLGTSSSSSGNAHNHDDLIRSEQERLLQAEIFIDLQQRTFDQRWAHLYELRRQWKQCVSQAKKEGLSPKMGRGKALKQQGIELEKEAEELGRELEVLHRSKLWLQKKKHRLAQYKKLVEDHICKTFPSSSEDRNRNWSVDSEKLVTGFFDPDQGACNFNFNAESSSKSARRGRDRRSASPMLASALIRIEERLDKVSSMISRASRHHRIMETSLPSDTHYVPHTPTHSHGHQRRKRGQFDELKTLTKSTPTYADSMRAT